MKKSSPGETVVSMLASYGQGLVSVADSADNNGGYASLINENTASAEHDVAMNANSIVMPNVNSFFVVVIIIVNIIWCKVSDYFCNNQIKLPFS